MARAAALPGLAAFPSIANPDFLAWSPTTSWSESIARGRPAAACPAGRKDGLRPAEIRAWWTISAASGVTPTHPIQPAALDHRGRRTRQARLFEPPAPAATAQGKGADAPALNNPVLLELATDTFLVETIAGAAAAPPWQGFLTADAGAARAHPRGESNPSWPISDLWGGKS
jgi:hypothetical protein